MRPKKGSEMWLEEKIQKRNRKKNQKNTWNRKILLPAECGSGTSVQASSSIYLKES
jgi:hypothetical protein